MIPIIADELVDPEFGTGAVKVTGAHDPNDFEMATRHGIDMPVIMNEHGIMEGSGTKFDGMDRFEARKAVVEELRAQGRIMGEKRPYVHAVGHCQRCDTTVEPRLSKQWFVKVAPLAKAAGDAVRNGEIKIEPEELAPRYFDWVDNMHDWCISRQLMVGPSDSSFLWSK
jgi:valyl-tRNA synthetase